MTPQNTTFAVALPLLYLLADSIELPAVPADADDAEIDDAPHKNFYLVATHQQFLIEQTIEPIRRSREICAAFKKELRQPRLLRHSVAPTASPQQRRTVR